MKIESTELAPCVELEMSRLCTSVCSDELHDTGAHRSLPTSVKLVGRQHACPMLTLARQRACTRLACGSRPRARTRHAICTRLMVLRGSSPRAATRASVQVGHDDLSQDVVEEKREFAPLLAAPAHERPAAGLCEITCVSASGRVAHAAVHARHAACRRTGAASQEMPASVQAERAGKLRPERTGSVRPRKRMI